MLAVYCAACERRELRCLRSIERVENRPGGVIVLTIRCGGCGRLCHLVTGAGRRNGNRAHLRLVRS